MSLVFVIVRRMEVRMKNLGIYPNGIFSGKAARVKNLLGFIPYLYDMRQGCQFVNTWSDSGIAGSALLCCSNELRQVYAIAEREPRKMSPQAIEDLRLACLRCCLQWKRAGGRCRMKHHVFACHLAEQCAWAGNFCWSHNYEDETQNLHTRIRGSSVHKIVFERRCLAKWLLANLPF